MKLVLLQALVVFVFCSFYTHKDDPKRKVKIIVIDPGHGGKDPGCNGVTCKEKEVALAVALKFGKLIEEHITSSGMDMLVRPISITDAEFKKK